MYTITITYKDVDNKSQVDIFENISAIVIDGNMLEIYTGGETSQIITYENVLIVQVVKSELL